MMNSLNYGMCHLSYIFIDCKWPTREKNHPTRGLRQGDPLTPYIFILCAEGLSSLINSAKNNGETRGVAISRGTLVNHLLFADVCISFGRANLVEWAKI